MILVVTNRQDFRAEWGESVMLPGQAVSVCTCLKEALTIAAVSSVDLVVVDVVAAGVASRLAADIVLAALVGSTRVLLGGTELDVESELSALAAGVAGCCSPRLHPEERTRVLDVVLKGGIWVSSAALPALLGRLRGESEAIHPAAVRGGEAGTHVSGWSQLTPREREIAIQVTRGESNKAIAKRLDISDATIKAHLTSVFHKLGVSSRLQLARLLISHEERSRMAEPLSS